VVAADLKTIYSAANAEMAEENLTRIFHKKEVANSFQAFKIRLNLTIQERNLP